ncbi:MAG TPA: hypothetical protein VM509_02365 [Planctomycetota bacterium]|nr:hypothetical protein [Planctomycetota bacterium]
MVEPFESKMQRGGEMALREVGRFFMRDDPVHRSLRRITAQLQQLEIPYAVAGAMALVAHGYDRTTVDVDLLVTKEGLARVHSALTGLGYVSVFAGSKALRDVETGVRIDFLVTGGFPGDGQPKPIAFPDPADCSLEIDGIRYLILERMVELKLASGMTNPGRIKDLADVQELIRVLRLDPAFSERIAPFVRAKYTELWNGVASAGDMES